MGKKTGYFYLLKTQHIPVSNRKGVNHGCVGSLAAMAPNCRGNFNLFWTHDIVHRKTRLISLGNNVPNLRVTLFRSDRSSCNSPGVLTSNVQIQPEYSVAGVRPIVNSTRSSVCPFWTLNKACDKLPLSAVSYSSYSEPLMIRVTCFRS